MKVSELIDRLKMFNPDFIVMIEGAMMDKLEYRDIVDVEQPCEDFDQGNEDLVILSPDLNNSMIIIDNTGLE
jgi:hypothetical protein